MLSLSRKKDESIIFFLPNGKLITVKVYEIRRDKVRISIDASSNIKILRNEVYNRMSIEKRKEFLNA